MEQEAQHIIDLYGLKPTQSFKTIRFFENDEIVLVLSGVGKIQASAATTILCQMYNPSWLINIGIAGSLLGNQARVWEVFLVNKVAQHDMYLPFEWSHLEYAKGQISLPFSLSWKVLTDLQYRSNAFCLTGDQFIDDPEKVAQLKKSSNADLVEMEAFAFAAVAQEFWKLDKCMIIKAISDGADDDARLAHMDNLDFAMKQSISLLQELVRFLLQN